jgi:hypothetical protein
MEEFGDYVDNNRTWESIKGKIKMSAKESLDCYKLTIKYSCIKQGKLNLNGYSIRENK